MKSQILFIYLSLSLFLLPKCYFLHLFLALKFRYIEGKERKKEKQEQNRIQPISLHQFPFYSNPILRKFLSWALFTCHKACGKWKRKLKKNCEFYINTFFLLYWNLLMLVLKICLHIKKKQREHFIKLWRNF